MVEGISPLSDPTFIIRGFRSERRGFSLSHNAMLTGSIFSRRMHYMFNNSKEKKFKLKWRTQTLFSTVEAESISCYLL